MFKWFKIVKKQHFGFWAIGLLLFAIQELPYMVMPLLRLETNPIMNMPTRSLFLDVCEKIFGVLCIVTMIFVVNKESSLFAVKSKNEIAFFAVAVGIIALNFVGWTLYFCGLQSVTIMIIFLFALPPLYYLFVGLWRKNYFLVAVSSAFFAIHLANAFVNLL